MKDGVGTGDIESCGGGHFAAEVAFGECGELHVVHPIACLGKQVSEGTEKDGFTRARGSHDNGAHAVLDGVVESVKGFIEELGAPPVLDWNLPGEGSFVKAEVGTKVQSGISRFHGRTPLEG
jgi:hypothetical protein